MVNVTTGMMTNNVPYGMGRVLKMENAIVHCTFKIMLNMVRKTFYENGKLAEEGVFEHGSQHGLWTMYFEDGKRWHKHL